MCVYMYVCMYVCICIYIYIYMHTYIYYTSLYHAMLWYTWLSSQGPGIHSSSRYVCMYVCICVYTYIYIYTHPVSITRFLLTRFSPGSGLLRNPLFYTIKAKIFQGLGPKRRESCNGDRVYIFTHTHIFVYLYNHITMQSYIYTYIYIYIKQQVS